MKGYGLNSKKPDWLMGYEYIVAIGRQAQPAHGQVAGHCQDGGPSELNSS